MTIEQMAVELLGLSTKERAVLAEKLLASLDEDASGDVDARWGELALRRLDEVEAGSVSPRPAEEVLTESRSKLKK